MALAAAPAQAQSEVQTTAEGIRADPVYVHPSQLGRLTIADQGRVRLQIVESAIGRIRVAVVPAEFASRSGGIQQFANQVERLSPVRGTLIVVAGSNYWAVTSYPQVDQAVSALRQAVAAGDDRLVDELVRAVRRIGRIDPGDPGPSQAVPGEIETGEDFLDDVGDTFRLGVLIVAVAIALPFIVGVALLLMRVRRRRARESEVREAGERSADSELVELGDEIRALDLDTSMPDANRAALAEYEQAIARYDQANDLLSGDPTEYRVEQALAAIAAGRRHVAAARERLG